ncbi:MAG: hypothetical protein HOQ45_20070, partial [Nocardioidaceae bacterium]|nr:hypothetical protein [Nocardioidaceae bacterium]
MRRAAFLAAASAVLVAGGSTAFAYANETIDGSGSLAVHAPAKPAAAT